MKSEANTFFATQAWVHGAWATNVLLEVDAAGHWSKVQANTPADQRGSAKMLDGPVLPGIVNAHSGRIWTQSELGHGATFLFSVPFAGPQRAAAPK